MSTNKTPTQTGFPVNSSDQEPGTARYSSLPSPQGMRNKSLFGIPLKSALTGQEIDDETIQKYINEAASEIEHDLDLYISPVTFTELYDYNRHDFTWHYNYLKLKHPNILNVSRLEVSFTNVTTQPGFINFPLEFVQVHPQEGVIQLVPAFGTSLSGWLMSVFSGTQFHALRSSTLNTFPGAVKVEYTCGFEQGKVPALLSSLVEITAAKNLLSAIGPLLFPYGSVSIGIDGASQSVGTPGPQFLAARIADLEKQKAEKMDAARGYYQRKFLVDFI